MIKLFKFTVIFLGLIVCASVAQAQSISSVGSPGVTKGETEVEARAGFSLAEDDNAQDERFRTRAHVDHGFTDWYAGRMIIEGDRRKNDNLEYDSITYESRFDLLDAETYGFDFGMRASYTYKDGDKTPSSARIGFYELVPLNNWQLRLNQLFDHDVGEDAESGVSFQSRLQLTYPVADIHRLGIETFNDFGNLRTVSGYSDQNHVAGPVLKGKFGENFAYETGYLAGVSNGSADHTFKFFLSRDF